MSDRSYPDTVSVTVDGRAYRGCGANSAFFARVGENGIDRPGQGEHDLSNTNWRVVSINWPTGADERLLLQLRP
jgi:hypothetical protein